MPTITKISPQVKQKDRLNIYCDGKFLFGLAAEGVIKNKLKVGRILSEKDIESLRSKEETAKLFDKALYFLTFRPRSQKEVKDYLAKKISQMTGLKFSDSINSPLVIIIVSKLEKYGYIDDLKFAKWFVSSRIKSKPKGKHQIKIELLKKGIEKEIAAQALELVVDEDKLAQKLIEKKLKSWANLNNQELKKKIFPYLLSRGFTYDTTRKMIAFFNKKD